MWLERKYTLLMGPRLERFKFKNDIASFRCILCGDSKINKFKTRGTIVLKVQRQFFHCHNCKATKSFGNFLKLVDPLLYDDYNKEKISEKLGISTPEEQYVFEKPVFKRVDDKLAELKKISQLKHDHPAKLYIQNRLIPPSQHFRFYYAPKFRTWVNSIIPEKLSENLQDEPRLIIPFLDENGVFFGFQGRSFNPNVDPKYRYITIMMDDNKPKVFGLDRIDFTKPISIVEGPIDSVFLTNCLASAGGKLQSELEKIGNIDHSATTIIYDNEPRNIDVIKNIQDAINQGYPVVIWPEKQKEKDINELFKSGVTNLDSYITLNTYSGLRATLELQKWRKV
jgi:hypothetical protein